MAQELFFVLKNMVNYSLSTAGIVSVSEEIPG